MLPVLWHMTRGLLAQRDSLIQNKPVHMNTRMNTNCRSYNYMHFWELITWVSQDVQFKSMHLVALWYTFQMIKGLAAWSMSSKFNKTNKGYLAIKKWGKL